MGAKAEVQPTKITAGLVLAWIFGILFTIAGFTATATGDVGFGIPLLLAGVVLLPVVRQLIRERMKFELSTGLLVLIVAVLLIVSIVNTPNSTNTGEGVPSRNTVSAAAPSTYQCPTGETAKSAAECPAVLQLGDRVPSGDFTWTFTKARWEYSVGSDFMRQEPDGVFLIVDVTVENTGTQAAYLSADMVKLVDDSGREFSPDTTAAFYIGDGALSFDRINPGIMKRGVLVYDVPEGVAFARVRLTNGLFGGESHYVNLVTT